MNPTAQPGAAPAKAGEPNVEPLRARGWQVATCRGPYCVFWKGGREVLLVWDGGSWRRPGNPAEFRG